MHKIFYNFSVNNTINKQEFNNLCKYIFDDEKLIFDEDITKFR